MILTKRRPQFRILILYLLISGIVTTIDDSINMIVTEENIQLIFRIGRWFVKLIVALIFLRISKMPYTLIMLSTLVVFSTVYLLGGSPVANFAAILAAWNFQSKL
jgi:hypothetical protein